MTTEEMELPRRPRRRLLTPLTGVLAAVLIAALGFIGGVQVQKHQGGASSGRAGFAAAAGFGGASSGGGGRAAGDPAGGGRFAGGGFGGSGGGGGGGGATIGSVANVDGTSLYVTETSGTTVRVKTDASTKVTRTATAGAGDIHPGDTVVVQGSSSGGSVAATAITATAKNAAPAGLGGGFFGGRGGFGGGRGSGDGGFGGS